MLLPASENASGELGAGLAMKPCKQVGHKGTCNRGHLLSSWTPQG